MCTPQTMNKVFEHAGDMVNIKVAHNLMRLIAEGFGEDDDAADTQLRSSAVCDLHLIIDYTNIYVCMSLSCKNPFDLFMMSINKILEAYGMEIVSRNMHM